MGLICSKYFNVHSVATRAYSFDGGEEAEEIHFSDGYKFGLMLKRRISKEYMNPLFLKTVFFYKYFDFKSSYNQYDNTISHEFDVQRKIFCWQPLLEKQFKLELFSLDVFFGIASRIKFEQVNSLEKNLIRGDVIYTSTDWHEIQFNHATNNGHNDYNALNIGNVIFTPQIGIDLEF